MADYLDGPDGDHQREPGRFTIGEDEAVAEWWCTVESESDPEDPWQGWVSAVSDARRGVVRLEYADGEFTPAEARLLADALRQAANHAEHFGRVAGAFLFGLTMGGHFPEIDHLPTEQQRAIRDALRKAGDRYRKSYSDNSAWAGRSCGDGAATGTPNQGGDR